jgi:hypothetical protein
MIFFMTCVKQLFPALLFPVMVSSDSLGYILSLIIHDFLNVVCIPYRTVVSCI